MRERKTTPRVRPNIDPGTVVDGVMMMVGHPEYPEFALGIETTMPDLKGAPGTYQFMWIDPLGRKRISSFMTTEFWTGYEWMLEVAHLMVQDGVRAPSKFEVDFRMKVLGVPKDGRSARRKKTR